MNWPAYQVMILLALLSIAYNEGVGLVNKRTDGKHPLAAAEVAVGTLYTIAGAWLIDGDCINIWTILLCFVASGIPMIYGDVARWLARIK